MTQLQDLVQAVEYLKTEAFIKSPSEKMMEFGSKPDLVDLYRLEEDEGLGEQVAEEVVVGQSDALKVSGGVDLLKQLRELRLQHVHLETNDRKTQLTY